MTLSVSKFPSIILDFYSWATIAAIMSSNNSQYPRIIPELVFMQQKQLNYFIIVTNIKFEALKFIFNNFQVTS